MPGRSADTAATLILVGLILQIVTVLILFVLSAVLSSFPIVGGLVLLAAIVGLIFVILVYIFSFVRAREGEYEQARAPTLVFGILSLISLGLISGILYIIAYVKLGDAADEEEPTGEAARVLYGGVPQESPALLYSPPSTPTPAFPAASRSSPSSPSGTVFCTNCGQPMAPQARFCRNCGTRNQ